MIQEGNIEEHNKAKLTKNVKLMLVRYGKMGILGWFEHHENHVPKTQTHVIIKTDRGLELGELIGPCAYRGGNFRLNAEQVDQYFKQADQSYEIVKGGRFVRFAQAEDLCEQEHLEQSAQEEAKCCQRFARDLGLDMKVIEAEHLFGGERIIFYFLSEGRVDFRELVKMLAREYQTRIELRQIGSRDEARLISDYESCGMECCCKRFLKILEPVNMRMAKLQKATLDPSKISGHCGRLKCCLRYEDITYRDLKKSLPPKNTPVRTPKGPGRVVDVQILTQLVVVQMENGDRQAWRLDEVELLDERSMNARPSQPSDRRPAPVQNAPDANTEDSNRPAEELPPDAADEIEPTADREFAQEYEPQASPEGDRSPGSQERDGSRNRSRRKKNRRRGPGGDPGRSQGADSNAPGRDGSGQNQSSNRRRGGRNRNRRNRSDRPNQNPNSQNGNQPSNGQGNS